MMSRHAEVHVVKRAWCYARHVQRLVIKGLYTYKHACIWQGVLTPFDRLDGYERRVQSGAAAPAEQTDASASQPISGKPLRCACRSHNLPRKPVHLSSCLTISSDLVPA